MDKQTLEQYRHCRREIRDIQNEIDILRRHHSVHDVTTGSQHEFPFVKHTVSVDGCDDDIAAQLAKLRRDQEACRSLMQEVENFVQRIGDWYIRKAIEQRYMIGDVKPSWVYVAMRMGGDNTADGVRKAVSRFLQKK